MADNLRTCIGRARDGGEISRERADQIIREYDEAFDYFREHFGRTEAEVKAAQSASNAFRQQAAQKKRRMQLQAAATRPLLERQKDWTDMRGNPDPGGFLQALISRVMGSDGSSLDGKFEAVRRAFRRDLAEATRQFRTYIGGFSSNRELMTATVRELFGEATGNADAAKIAKAWSGVAERARTRANAAGMQIGRRLDWALPQMHDTDKIRRAGYREWRAYIMGEDRGGVPRIDLDAMGQQWNDGVPYTPQTIEPVLFDSFEAIRTDGYSRSGAKAFSGTSLANRRGDHRFFKFTGADDWMAYSQKFGAGRDPWRVMLGHLDNMALDISMLEMLGPNPAHTWRYLIDNAKNLAARSDDPQAINRAEARAMRADDMMDLFTGRGNMPENAKFAKGAAAVRSYLTAAHLGSAVFSAVTDFNYQQMMAGLVGLNRAGFMRQLFRLATSRATRDAAHEAGLIYENGVAIGHGVQRYQMEDVFLEAPHQLADATIRASGLGWLTEVQRQSFGLQFMTEAARWAQADWKNLDPKTRRALMDYGIGERDWPGIQAASAHTTSNGLTLLRAQEIEAASGSDLADRYMEAIVRLTDQAVPTADIFSRATVVGRTRPGSISGELLRGVMQFKSFPIFVMVNHVGRVMQEAYRGRPMTAVSLAAQMVVINTILGGLALQLKELSKGRDPRDQTKPEFWGAALAQGGGVGIFGDFLFADHNRFGGGLASTIAGPTVGFGEAAARLTAGNVQQIATGDDPRLARDAVDFARRYTPGGSLWYLRLAYEREILDQIQMLADPEAHRAFRRRAASMGQYGTEYYSRPGERLSDARAPDFGNAMGGR